MNKVNIGIDVDMTTLASDEAWWRWLHHMTRQVDTYPKGFDPVDGLNAMKNSFDPIDYYLPNYFDEPLNENVHPLDFWRNEGCYDTVMPVPGAVENITYLMSRDDVEVTFVTHNKGNGGRSKYNCLARFFGKGNFNMIVTREKHLVDIHCLVDDRIDFLNPCAAKGITPFLFSTHMKQEEEAKFPMLVSHTWYQQRASIEAWIELGYPSDATVTLLHDMPKTW